MAKPIEFIPAARDARDELKQRIESAPVEHAAAVLSAYRLLEELYQSGLLDLLRGAASAGGEIVTQASALAVQPESIRAMQNLLVLGKLLGSMNPDVLHGLTEKLPSVVAQSPVKEPPSLFRILQRITSKDSRRALAAVVDALESIGHGMNPEK